MRQQITKQTGVGQSTPVILDPKVKAFNVGFGCAVSGTPTYTVQYCYDDLLGNTGNRVTIANATWYPHSVLNGVSVSMSNSFTSPVSAVRINVTGVVAGTDSVTMTLIQEGQAGA